MMKYKSYKQSGFEWIGEIPTHWEVKKFKHFIQEIGDGGTPSRSVEDNFGGEINWIVVSDIKDRIYSTKETLSQKGFNSSSTKMWDIGDVIISLGGTIGKVGILEVPSTTKQGICGIKPNQTTTNKYIFYLLQLNSQLFNDWSVGSTIFEFRSTRLRELHFQIPPLQEQHQIVQYLDSKTELIDKLISTKERKITLLNEQRTSLINQVVTKGLNPNVKMKLIGVEWIGEIPEHWELISLHKLLQTNRLEFQDGNHGGEHPNPEEFIENGVPFIKPRDIQNGKVDWSECDRLPFERTSRFRIGFSNNDDVLLVNRGGSIGKVCYINDYDNEFPYFVINPQVTYLRGKNGLSSKYVFYITKSDVFRCGVDLVLGHGSTFPFLGLSNMGDFQMVLPPSIEQEEIVKFLDIQTKEIDDLIQLEQKKIDLLKEYRKSLISEVVTGKIKVTTDE